MNTSENDFDNIKNTQIHRGSGWKKDQNQLFPRGLLHLHNMNFTFRFCKLVTIVQHTGWCDFMMHGPGWQFLTKKNSSQISFLAVKHMIHSMIGCF